MRHVTSIGLLLFLLVMPVAFGLNVELVSEKHSIGTHEVIVRVTNNESKPIPFQLGFYLSQTTFLPKDAKITIYELKNVTEVRKVREPIYGKRVVNTTNGTTEREVIVSYRQRKISETKEKWVRFKPRKQISKVLRRVKVRHKKENLTKSKLYKIKWETPIEWTGEGWGSKGYFAVTDEVTGIDYDPWWNSNWQYRRIIYINNTAGEVYDYQMVFNITYDSDMQPDFDDLRFTWYNATSNTEQEIPYWIEEQVNSSWAYVWVRIPYLPNATDIDTVKMYYGNPTATSVSSGDDTFLFFDDFNDGILDTSKWVRVDSGGGTVTEANGYLEIDKSTPEYVILRTADTYPITYGLRADYKFYIVNETNKNCGSQFTTDPNAATGSYYRLYNFHDVDTTADFYIDSNADGTYETYADYVVLSTGVWYNDAYILATLNEAEVGINGLSYYYDTTKFPDVNFYVMIGGWTTSNTATTTHVLRYDDFRVRRYITPLPTYSIGLEENYTAPVLTLNVLKPKNNWVYYTTVIDCEVLWSNATECYYQLNNQKNISLPCKENFTIEIPYNVGNVSLTFTQINASGTVSKTITFQVNNELNTGKAFMLSIIPTVLMFVALGLFFVANRIHTSHVALRLFIILLGLFIHILGFIIINILTTHYLHITSLGSVLGDYIFIFGLIYYTIIAYFLAYFIFTIFAWVYKVVVK